VIEYVFDLIGGQAGELWSFLEANFDPVRDTMDVLLVAVGIYWLLLLIKGTRAVQILVGLGALIGLRVAADFFELLTLACRLGRGFFPRLSERQESQLVEDVVRAAQSLSARRVGALIVLERRTGLDDQVESGTPIDAAVSKDLLVSLFQPTSPLHDGAVLIQQGRVSHAGAILPLTLRTDLPEGVGTRHRAAVGITEETDAAVIVVSEETGAISVVMGGEMIRSLDAPRLRVVLRDALARPEEETPEPESASSASSAAEAGTR
jgi:diadenylate cyclase